MYFVDSGIAKDSSQLKPTYTERLSIGYINNLKEEHYKESWVDKDIRNLTTKFNKLDIASCTRLSCSGHADEYNERGYILFYSANPHGLMELLDGILTRALDILLDEDNQILPQLNLQLNRSILIHPESKVLEEVSKEERLITTVVIEWFGDNIERARIIAALETSLGNLVK